MTRELLNVTEACEVLGLGRSSLYKLMKAREIKPTRGRGVRRTLFSRAELERWIRDNTRPARR